MNLDSIVQIRQALEDLIRHADEVADLAQALRNEQLTNLTNQIIGQARAESEELSRFFS